MPHGPVIATLTVSADQVRADLQLTDMRDLAPAVARLRHLLDLDADPSAVDEALLSHRVLAPLVTEAPGIRVPGTVDGAELLLRTMIGQQISVAAANTATASLVAALGEEVTDATGRVTHLFRPPKPLLPQPRRSWPGQRHGSQRSPGPPTGSQQENWSCIMA